jgi:hypothetical protein
MIVTLTTKFTNYRLLTLIRAITGYAKVGESCRELQLQWDKVGSSGATIYIGRGDMGPNNGGGGPATGYNGLIDTTERTRVYRSNTSDVPLGDIYLQSDTAAKSVNIDILPR